MGTTYSSVDFEKMQTFFFTGATSTYEFRKKQLIKLRSTIEKYENEISEALHADLHKSAEEAYSTEIGFIYSEISHTLKHLKSWMKPRSVSTPIILFPSSSKIIREALGVTLIIAPWNYPFQLLMAPLIGAIAGGNCAVLKPSEMTMNTSKVITKIVRETFDSNYITAVEGDGAVVVPQMMNDNRFDHVFFTGSIAVGKEIAKLAAPKLVSVTLELGGKSPCVVDKDADVRVAAQRIVWGKFTNAGQTCVAPDYLLVHESRRDELVANMQKSIQSFFGDDPQLSNYYGRIINEKRFDKLSSYLENASIVSGGKTSKEQLYIEPTVIDNVTLNQAVMQEEIFGPILPVFTYQKHDEALSLIKKSSHPLALYVFTNNKEVEQLYLDKVQFGGGCINNTLLHLANAELPFGGVGNSGVGAYHGKFSFDTFTRPKSVLKTATWLDLKVKYPPYTGKLKMMKMLFK
jgi:aldehyde dehydrogenase (NAD+)